eukprot:1467872-Rhodomonas_salina.2
MSGTDLARITCCQRPKQGGFEPILYQDVEHARLGTLAPYARATPCPVLMLRGIQYYHKLSCYVRATTCLGAGVSRSRDPAILVRAAYAESGTDVQYGGSYHATRLLRDVRY